MNNELDKPRKVEFDYLLRGFICPRCHYGTYNGNHRCKRCGQLLIDRYNFDKGEK